MSARARWHRLTDLLRGLSSRDRRALLVGVALLAPALLWVAVVRPYVGALRDLQDRVASERALLEREKAVLAEAPTLPARLEVARLALSQWESRLVQSANPALAEAEVTALLEEVARQSLVLLQEARSIAAPPGTVAPDGLVPLRLSVRGESDFEGVLRFLSGMEQDGLLLRVVGLSVTPVAATGGGGRGGGAQVQAGTVSFVAIVESFLPEAAAGAGDTR